VARGAGTHFRNSDGTLTPVPFVAAHFPDFPGGGGLLSTGLDYIRLTRPTQSKLMLYSEHSAPDGRGPQLVTIAAGVSQ
jgi:hypothetical protein